MYVSRQTLKWFSSVCSNQKTVFDAQSTPWCTKHWNVDREDHVSRQLVLIPGCQNRRFKFDDANTVNAGIGKVLLQALGAADIPGNPVDALAYRAGFNAAAAASCALIATETAASISGRILPTAATRPMAP